MWIDIFKAGNHTDSQGRQQRWTTDDLDHTVATYKPEKHEAPVVIGHPKTNGPAFGWVDCLRRTGDLLQAQLKDVSVEFKEWVNKGTFKKRSSSFYPDKTLRHVGFLGAQPPAVKGLKNFKFNESGEETYDQADLLDYEEKVSVPEGEGDPKKSDKQKTEEKRVSKELEKKLADAQKELEKEKKAKEVALKTAQAKEAEFAEHKQKERKEQVKADLKRLTDEGKILPAWQKKGLSNFMEALSEDEAVIEYGENDKGSLYTRFLEFMDEVGSHPLFKEMAKGEDKKGDSDASEYAEEDRLAKEIADHVNPPKS